MIDQRLGIGCFLALAHVSMVSAQEQAPPPSPHQAVQAYLLRIKEIEDSAATAKTIAQERLMAALQNTEASALSGPRYRGMLGSYFNQDGRLPFILLSVPNGENVFGKYAESIFNGRYDFTKPLVRFRARGHVIIPSDGNYCLEVGRGYENFKLNDVGYSLREQTPKNRYYADVVLKAGNYEVDVSTNNNGGQLPETSIRIVDLKTKQDLDLFFYESELKAFQTEYAAGTEPTETSKWTADENRLR